MESVHELKDHLKALQDALGYTFKDSSLLVEAFTHSSFLNEHPEEVTESNERLEFLGDAVLGILVTQYLFEKFPNHPEGTLSNYRSKLVEGTSCTQYVEKLQLHSYLLLGRGEQLQYSQDPHPSMSADLFEALIGALFIDGGLKAADAFLSNHYLEDFEDILKNPSRNWKAELQDYTQKRYQKIPTYQVLEEVGPDHNKTFQIAVFIDDMNLGTGYGSSKKGAEQAAASDALYRLNLSNN